MKVLVPCVFMYEARRGALAESWWLRRHPVEQWPERLRWLDLLTTVEEAANAHDCDDPRCSICRERIRTHGQTKPSVPSLRCECGEVVRGIPELCRHTLLTHRRGPSRDERVPVAA